MRNINIFLILALCTVMIASCKHDGAHMKETAEETVDKTGPEYTSQYICPMHCEGSGSDSLGICPTCGMDYVVNENQGNIWKAEEEVHFEGDGHDHGTEGHEHAEKKDESK